MTTVSNNEQLTSDSEAYVSPGMPKLKAGKITSFFEFWPTAVVYLPVVAQTLVLAIRYRSLTLPLLANPKLPLAGMVGVAKSELLRQASGPATESILDWITIKRDTTPSSEQAATIETLMRGHTIDYPMVCKPDIGCRGIGVKLIHTRQQLENCLQHYPAGASLLVQRLSDYEPEAGVFYVREPGAAHGRIISMALKYMPYVVGDGKSTLSELVAQEPRAGALSHLYEQRHTENWHSVIPKDQPYRLIFAASHCRGAVFKDANHLITPELTASLDALLQHIPEFYYGRLDIKFKNVASLQQGEELQIVEINTASSESLHIWDSETPFTEAMRALLLQYRLLFRIGAANRKLGYKPPPLRELLTAWRLERTLSRHYPETD